MTHALKRQLLNKSFNFEFRNHYDDYLELANIEMERIKNKKESMLREYAGKNLDEFLSVAVEHFFEVPHVMYKKLPDLYKTLTRLLKQDPRNEEAPIL